MSEWRLYWRSLAAFAAFAGCFVLWQGVRSWLRRKLFRSRARKGADMGFFATLRDDVEAIGKKLEAVVKQYGPRVEDEVKAETLAVVTKLIAYVESKLPEAEAAVAAFADKLVPGLGAAVAAAEAIVAPKVEAEVQQKIDPEDPHSS